MSRRENTERLILQALESQILETGMGGVGINAIAKRAGVSKELIYRYFDGMPGLMLAWMQEQDFWTRNPGLLAADESSQRTPGDLVLSMLRAQIDALSGNETLREVRRWELIERNEVSAPLAERRERAARGFIDRVDGLAPDVDVPAVVSVMLAGVLYLMLRAKTESHFLGVPLRTEEGWDRINGALEHLVAHGFPTALNTESLANLEARRPPRPAAPPEP
ncbi:TetR/AcrR family transcriptional regulator [Achromobacter sp.]|uniref:TetR/AcrR family transcriptional regulator n=1 Tax=Achromobacter sp. TaxID=134375 RepID=UPI0028A81CFB|nr:TetR/AcrR family transcriptional regulator [Achromobacter sp.]